MQKTHLVAGALALSLLSGAGFYALAQPSKKPLLGQHISRSTFPNKHAHIPAQCYAETSFERLAAREADPRFKVLMQEAGGATG